MRRLQLRLVCWDSTSTSRGVRGAGICQGQVAVALMFRCLNSLATNRTRQPSPSVCACVPIESKWHMITAAGLPFQSATLLPCLPLQLLLRRLSLRRLLQLRLQAVIRLLHHKVRDAISKCPLLLTSRLTLIHTGFYYFYSIFLSLWTAAAAVQATGWNILAAALVTKWIILFFCVFASLNCVMNIWDYKWF